MFAISGENVRGRNGYGLWFHEHYSLVPFYFVVGGIFMKYAGSKNTFAVT